MEVSVLEIIPSSVRHRSVAPTDRFSGEVWRDLDREHGDGPAIGSLFFAPSARTHWHVHESGQLLIVLAGAGLVGDADGAIEIVAGNMVWTPAGVSHWHGASPDQYLAYTTVSWGAAIWAYPVSEQEYRNTEEKVMNGGSAVSGP
jgi:quercetin dioxygenase-like cupin family protein